MATPPSPTIPADAALPSLGADDDLSTEDLSLLARFEPVIRYTQGEHFFPAAVDDYLAACDLWAGRSERDRRLLVPRGELTVERLVAASAPRGENLYLRFVQKPMSSLELARWNLRPGRPIFHSPGRLARVGLFARLVDAGFTASLLLRGTVPGGTAAAAAREYEAHRARDPRNVYYGRVVRRGGWIALHYLFFYFMNDYRSTFSGANDHEADWEQVFVYLDDAPAGPSPVWVGAAAHDYTGDDLRRRWDDPDLERDGEHVVINAGAGSHASYFEAGDYVTTIPLPAFRRLRGFLDGMRAFWHDTLRQPDPGDLAAKFETALSVPFIDYARSDGRAIGPGQAEGWTRLPIGDDVPWVDGYRGLFGLDTRDRFAGERAPAGPKYTRTGTVRRSWFDPLGFVGLTKVPPPHRAPDELLGRIEQMARELDVARAEADAAVAALPALELEVNALAADGAFASLHAARSVELRARDAAAAALDAGVVDLQEGLRAAGAELLRIERGDWGSPTAHLQHAHHPVSPEQTRYGFVVEVWAAISVSALLVGIVALVWTGAVPWWDALLIAVGAYAVIEAAFRRRLTTLLLRVSLVLAIVSLAVLAVIWAPQLAVLALVALAFIVVADNVREVVRR